MLDFHLTENSGTIVGDSDVAIWRNKDFVQTYRGSVVVLGEGNTRTSRSQGCPDDIGDSTRGQYMGLESR